MASRRKSQEETQVGVEEKVFKKLQSTSPHTFRIEVLFNFSIWKAILFTKQLSIVGSLIDPHPVCKTIWKAYKQPHRNLSQSTTETGPIEFSSFSLFLFLFLLSQFPSPSESVLYSHYHCIHCSGSCPVGSPWGQKLKAWENSLMPKLPASPTPTSHRCLDVDGPL